jgi:SAM-dependent methyltransferase
MTTYALLLRPSANRVYADAAAQLCAAELEVFSRSALAGRLGPVTVTSIGGIDYLTFEAPPLGEDDLAYLANASAVYALFEQTEERLLRPVTLTPMDQFDDDLVTILKYPGKTNEQFTKLLLNVTVLSSAAAGDMLRRRLQVLDPLCGRGTTLNQALSYGYDAVGIDHDSKDFDAYEAFVKTYLQRKRIKHHAQVSAIRRERRVVGRRMTVALSPSRERYRDGDTLTLDVVQADTTEAATYVRPGTVDVVVTDAPYGVAHGSRSTAAGLRRGPLDLLAEAVPVWARLLRPGGAMGIAWNTVVAKRGDITATLETAGLEVLDDGPYARFCHRVDQSIIRDILIARRPRPVGHP